MALTPQQWGDVYKQYQSATAGGWQGNESATGAPSFKNWATANLSPDMASQVTSELGPYGDPWQASQQGYGNFPQVFKSTGGSFLSDLAGGVKNIAGALAPAALVTMGIPALAGQPGLGSAIAANYAGAPAVAGASGGVPSDLSMVNLPGPAGMSTANAPADLGMVNLPGPAGGWANDALLTGAGASALGLAGSTGAVNVPGLTGAAPSAPAGAVPAAASGAGGAATGAAPAAAAGTGAGAAATGNTAVDSILASLKKNALSLGLMGGSLLGAGAVGQKPMPGQETLTNLGNMSADVAKQYLTAAQSGNLTAPQQASLDQYTQQAKNQVRQYFESIGQGSSSARMQAEQQVDQTALAMKQQLLQQTLASGLQALGVAQGPLNTVAQYQLGQDQALQQALGRFATGAGLLAGTNAGGQTAEAAKTVAATQ